MVNGDLELCFVILQGHVEDAEHVLDDVWLTM